MDGHPQMQKQQQTPAKGNNSSNNHGNRKTSRVSKSTSTSNKALYSFMKDLIHEYVDAGKNLSVAQDNARMPLYTKTGNATNSSTAVCSPSASSPATKKRGIHSSTTLSRWSNSSPAAAMVALQNAVSVIENVPGSSPSKSSPIGKPRSCPRYILESSMGGSSSPSSSPLTYFNSKTSPTSRRLSSSSQHSDRWVGLDRDNKGCCSPPSPPCRMTTPLSSTAGSSVAHKSAYSRDISSKSSYEQLQHQEESHHDNNMNRASVPSTEKQKSNGVYSKLTSNKTHLPESLRLPPY